MMDCKEPLIIQLEEYFKRCYSLKHNPALSFNTSQAYLFHATAPDSDIASIHKYTLISPMAVYISNSPIKCSTMSHIFSFHYLFNTLYSLSPAEEACRRYSSMVRSRIIINYEVVTIVAIYISL